MKLLVTVHGMESSRHTPCAVRHPIVRFSGRHTECACYYGAAAAMLALCLAFGRPALATGQDRQPQNDELAQARATIDALRAENTALRKEVDTLRAECKNLQAERDEMIKKLVALTDQIHSRIQEQQKDTAVSRKELRKKVKDLPVAGVTFVTAVEKEIVEVSIGSDDGIEAGDKLEVYRMSHGQTTYVGRIVVVKTTPDKAVCKVLPETKTAIEKGDRVSP